MKKHPLADCERCTLNSSRNAFVPTYRPEGKIKIVVVGEAPGFKEGKEGRPFVGASGRLLTAVLEGHDINPSETMLTNTCLCRPEDNATPTKLEVACCSKRLKAEILDAKPEVILSLGNTATSAIMNEPIKITKYRAGPPKTSPLYPDVKVIPSIHPAACLRQADSFLTLVTDIGKINTDFSTRWEPPVFRVAQNVQQAEYALEELMKKERVVIDIETSFDKDNSFQHSDHHRLLCVGFCYGRGKAYVIAEEELKAPSVRALMKQFLENPNVKLCAHNGKFDLAGLWSLGKGTLSFDTMLASYCVDERQGTHGLKYLAAEILGAPEYDLEMKRFKNFADAPTDLLHRYNAWDVAATWLLWDHYEGSMDPGARSLQGFLSAASDALMRVEMKGIRVDLDYLVEIRSQLVVELNDLEWKLNQYGMEDGRPYDWASIDGMNPRSPIQVKKALSKLGFRVQSTDVMNLQALLKKPGAKDFAELMLQYRKIQKLFSTYVDGIEKRLHNGKAYTSFLLHGTTTGRLSSRENNLQNIPRGSYIRKMFVPEPAHIFVQADYAQVELRVVACLAECGYLQEVLSDASRDIHQEVANRLGITRQKAKMVVYGLAYEMSGYGLATRLDIPQSEGERYLHEFHQVIPEVIAWKASIAQAVKSSDDLTTPYGRRRRFHLVTRDNLHDLIKEGTAYKPQSIASDINLTALIRLINMGIDVRLPVHDSILVQARQENAIEVANTMREVMEQAGREYSTYVPFTVDIKFGESWGDL